MAKVAKNTDIHGNRFLTTLAEILYALLHLDATEDSRLSLSYTKIHGLLHHEVADHFANVDPFAFIEAKKLAGGKTVSQQEMGEAMERDCEYLKRELDILRPNIIVCFDRYNSQFNFITRRYFGDKEAQVIAYDYTDESGRKLIGQRCCLWYYPDDNVVVIRSYHPSYGALWKTFERVVWTQSTFPRTNAAGRWRSSIPMRQSSSTAVQRNIIWLCLSLT